MAKLRRAQVAAQFGVDESSLRYRLHRPPEAVDVWRDRATALDGWGAVVQTSWHVSAIGG